MASQTPSVNPEAGNQGPNEDPLPVYDDTTGVLDPARMVSTLKPKSQVSFLPYSLFYNLNLSGVQMTDALTYI
jgi:hypothetical protein